ncbi:MAG: PAS domain S-box protein [Methylococcaceae bacterium]|nr:MAG: PAS domain S-box protein [Methylococcaceae bacterium]
MMNPATQQLDLTLFGRVFDVVNQGLILLDDQQRIVLWNAWVAQHTGIKSSDVARRTLSETFEQPLPKALQSAINTAITHGLPTVLANTLHKSPLPLYDPQNIDHQGKRIQQSIHITPVRDANEHRYCLIQISDVGISLNREQILRSQASDLRQQISWRKQQIEREVKVREKTELRITAIIDSAPDAMIIADTDGIITLINRQSERMLGYLRQELIGRSIECLVPVRFRDNHPALRESYTQSPEARLMDAGRVVSVMRKDGSEFSAEIGLSPIETDDGMLFVSSLRDITDRHHIEMALREAEEHLRIIFESASIGMALISPEGRLLQVNSALCHILGYTTADMMRLNFQGVTYPDDLEQEIPLLNALTAGRCSHYQLEKRYLHKNGHIVWVLFSQSKITSNDGKTSYFIGEFQDITTRKQAEEDLRIAYEAMAETEKMTALGGLVAGVAHEINTPIGVNLASASHLQADTQKVSARYAEGELSGDELEDYFATAAQAAKLMVVNSQRAADLIQSFKQVAVDQAGGERRPFDLRGYIDEILLSLQPRYKYLPVRIAVDCPADITVDGFPGALSQILVNLILNALTHGFDGDRGGNIAIRANLATDDMVEITVADDGKGISADIQRRIFDPFFTTRRGQGGSGLGLSIAFNLAQRLGGNLRICSKAEHQQGAAFILRFPRVSTI